MDKIFNVGFIKTDNRNDILLSKDIKTKYKELNNSGKGEKLFIKYLVEIIGCELDTTKKSIHKVLMIKFKNEEQEEKEEKVDKNILHQCTDFMNKFTNLDRKDKIKTTIITDLYKYYCDHNKLYFNKIDIHQYIKNTLNYKDKSNKYRYYQDFILNDYANSIIDTLEKAKPISNLILFMDTNMIKQIYDDMFEYKENNKLAASYIKYVFETSFCYSGDNIINYLRMISPFKQNSNGNYENLSLKSKYNPNRFFNQILIKTDNDNDIVKKSIVGKSYKDLNGGNTIYQTEFYSYIVNEMKVKIDIHKKNYIGVKLLHHGEKLTNQCLYEKCTKSAVYGINLTERATVCGNHRTEDMINVTGYYCIKENCNTLATYNKNGKGAPTWCIVHGLEVGESLRVRDDNCINEDCNKRASFNYNGMKPIYCKEHALEINKNEHDYNKLDDENYIIDVVHNKCLITECFIRACFNKSNETKGIYCYDHKEENMINVVSKNCINEGCTKQGITIHNYYCADCYNEGNKIYGLKEKAIMEELNKYYPELIYNNKISKNCQLRPDILIKFVEYDIIIEIDEHSHVHTNYNREEESNRINCIQKALGKDIVVIRINPDNYRVNNQLYKGILLKGAIIDQDELKKRVETLVKIIKEFEYREDEFDNHIKYVYLYYSDRYL